MPRSHGIEAASSPCPAPSSSLASHLIHKSGRMHIHPPAAPPQDRHMTAIRRQGAISRWHTRGPDMPWQGRAGYWTRIIGGSSHVFGRVLQKGSAVRGAEEADDHHR